MEQAASVMQAIVLSLGVIALICIIRFVDEPERKDRDGRIIIPPPMYSVQGPLIGIVCGLVIVFLFTCGSLKEYKPSVKVITPEINSISSEGGVK